MYVRVASPSGCQTLFPPKSPLTATWFEYDVSPGSVSFAAAPSATTSVPFGDFSLSVSADPRLLTLQYSLDGRDWMACDTSFRVGPLAPGTHMVSARAVDSSGTVYSAVVQYSWLVQASSASSLLLTVPDEGNHTLAVWAVDSLGNRNVDPVEWTWTLDSTPPVTLATLTGGSSITNAPVVTVAVVYGGEQHPELCSVCWQASGVLSGSGCTNTTLSFGYVRDGTASLSLESADAAGNVAQPMVLSWTWDTSPPRTIAAPSLACDVFGAGTLHSMTATWRTCLCAFVCVSLLCSVRCPIPEIRTFCVCNAGVVLLCSVKVSAPAQW